MLRLLTARYNRKAMLHKEQLRAVVSVWLNDISMLSEAICTLYCFSLFGCRHLMRRSEFTWCKYTPGVTYLALGWSHYWSHDCEVALKNIIKHIHTHTHSHTHTYIECNAHVGHYIVLPLFVKYKCTHARDGIVVICYDGQNDKVVMLNFQ